MKMKTEKRKSRQTRKRSDDVHGFVSNEACSRWMKKIIQRLRDANLKRTVEDKIKLNRIIEETLQEASEAGDIQSGAIMPVYHSLVSQIIKHNS